ncbi:MAG: amidohydrolase family protein [Kiritimatiellae bacterium]|nr:amidohydrolase family protein [Kiritimatiellia bacterium]
MPKPEYFIDVNCMIGTLPDMELAFSRAPDLLREMDYHGISKAIVFHLASRHDNTPRLGNALVVSEVAGQERLLPGWVLLPMNTPEMPPLRNLKSLLKENKIRAVRLYPRLHSWVLNQWNCGDLLALLEEIRIPVIIDLDQFGDEHWWIDLRDLYSLCRDYPLLPVIVTNTSIYSSRQFYSLFEKCRNFNLEISTYFISEGLGDIVRRFGSLNIIYGSRMPFQGPGSSMAYLLYSAIPVEDMENIAHGNIEKILGQTKLE